MSLKAFPYFLLFVLGFSLLAGCSKSDDQRDFENQAFTEPERITETEENGNIVDTDSDDWRISPMYRGLVSIGTPNEQPPYPNPLSFNQNLTINIYIRSIETLNRIEVSSFEFSSEYNAAPIAVRDNLSSPMLVNINLNGSSISGSTGGSQAAGLYRLLIYDGQQNLVTYGDIRIE